MAEQDENTPVEKAQKEVETESDKPVKIVLDHKQIADRYADEHDLHRYDTNGWSGHPDAVERAELRLNKAAMAYCYHMHSGGHDTCVADQIDCPFFVGLMDAYMMVITTT